MKITMAVVLMLGGVSFALAGQDAAPAPDTSVYVVADGDSLWKLAGKYYGNPDAWPLIYKINKDAIKNPHWIFPGQTITVPASFCVPRASGSVSAAGEEGNAPEDVVVVKDEGTGAFEEVGAEGLVPAGAELEPPQGDKAAEPVVVSAAAAKSKTVVTLGGGTASAGGVENKVSGQPALTDSPKNFKTSEKVSWGSVPKNTVSEAMPKDQIWGFPYEADRQVPVDWKEDGTVKFCDPDNEFDETAANDDLVVVALKVKVAVGDSLTVYRRSDYVRDREGKRTGLHIAVSALLEVEKLDGDKVYARVKKLVNPVSTGDLVKKE